MMLKKILCASLLCTAFFNVSAKPSIWVYSDLSDPRDLRGHGHPQNDPDDISALGSLLLTADEFNIEGIVFSSTNREGLKDATPFMQASFVDAYNRSVPALRAAGYDFQERIDFIRSDIIKNGKPIKFKPEKNYADLSQFQSVAPLAKLLTQKPIYVLNWGPLTESAVLVKHLLDTNNEVALNNLTVISHWTKSATAQGTIEKPFHVANCRDDYKACMYLHDEALVNPLVKFVEIGPAGQSGVVNGSAKFDNFPVFTQSPLGQLFYHGKFYNGKPDNSDSATFWVLTEFGANLSDYKNDGSLSLEEEKAVVKLFRDDGKAIVEYQAKKSNASASVKPFSNKQIADWFTYVYVKKGKIEVHMPHAGEFELKTVAGKPLLTANLARGDYEFEFKQYKPTKLVATVKSEGVVKTLKIGNAEYR